MRRALLLVAGMLLCAGVQAAAPMVKTQPGFYRLMVGDLEVTAISDGAVAFPVDRFLGGISRARIAQLLARGRVKSPLDVSVNAYLVNTGTKLVMIDTGAGRLFGTALGRLVESLKAAGYSPEQVDEIYITHMHADHMGGLAVDGRALFPNAVVRADRRDAEYWLRAENIAKAAADDRVNFETAQAALAPYVKAGRFSTFDGDAELVPGVRAVVAYGHTPGHTMYPVESKGQKLLLWGDLMHVAEVEFSALDATFQSDTDFKAAAAQRRKIYADAAKRGYLVGGAHLSFPGIGRLRAEGNGYAWVPVPYALP